MIRTSFAGLLCLFAAAAHGQAAPITGSTCVAPGAPIEVRTTIRITGGIWDGGCRTYIAGPGMESTSTGEQIAAQSIMFRLENGATLRNVIIVPTTTPLRWSAQAIVIYGGATLENVH